MTWREGLILAVLLWFPLAFAISALRAGRSSRFWALRDRVGIVTGAAESLAALAFGRALGPWDVVPPAVWGLGVGLAALGLLLGARSWSVLPTVRAGAKPAGRLATAMIDVVITAAIVVLVS